MKNHSATPSPESPNELTSTIHFSALAPLLEGALSERPNSSGAMEWLSEEERSVVSQLPEGSAMLVCLAGPAKGSRFLLNVTATTIGRDPASDIFLDDVTVSRKHALIEHLIGGDYSGQDLDSLNGTYLNGAPLKNFSLLPGDEIQIGKYKLTFFLKEGSK
jgi:pSer/pThr/pTyr-binding forkhead associated (FHA) protein